MSQALKKNAVSPKSSAIKPTGQTLPTTEADSALVKGLSANQVRLLIELLQETRYKINLIERVLFRLR